MIPIGALVGHGRRAGWYGLAIILPTACGGAATNDRNLYVRALEAGTEPAMAIALCLAIRQEESADECLAELARQHAEVGGEPCAHIHSEAWRQECHFAVAEHDAASGERWDALVNCGKAGRYTNECLYHVWTRELQDLVTSPPAGDLGADLASTVERASEIVDYYGQAETCGPDQPTRVWNDFWYFYWLHNRPARLDDCARLAPPVDMRCQEGTLSYVERVVSDALLCKNRDCDLLDRACRSSAVQPALLTPHTGGDPRLDAAVERALGRLCDPATADSRPWNPIFQQRAPLPPGPWGETYAPFQAPPLD